MNARRDVFHAIADPTRRDILTLIAGKSMHLNSIAENFEVSRPAVSQHIKILTECGLIAIRKDGRHRYCEVKPDNLTEVVDWLEPFKKLWEQRFQKLDALLEELKTQSKDDKK